MCLSPVPLCESHDITPDRLERCHRSKSCHHSNSILHPKRRKFHFRVSRESVFQTPPPSLTFPRPPSSSRSEVWILLFDIDFDLSEWTTLIVYKFLLKLIHSLSHVVCLLLDINLVTQLLLSLGVTERKKISSLFFFFEEKFFPQTMQSFQEAVETDVT